MVHVRHFEQKDAQHVSEILIAAFKSFLRDRFDEISAASFAPEELIKGAHVKDKFAVSEIFVAEEEGKILGAVKATAGSNGLGAFDYVGVDPEYHCHGVGSILMAKAEEFWAKHKQRKIHTCVSAHNKRAIMYYLKHDFVPEGYCKDHFREGVDEIILGRFLKSTETRPKRCRHPQ